MRLIDADALKQADFQDFSNTDVFNAIDESPTVEAVPVVRCKDCKHYQIDVLFNSNYCCGRRRKPDDYCSYGERKESDGGT